jgi:hypothetical protein
MELMVYAVYSTLMKIQLELKALSTSCFINSIKLMEIIKLFNIVKVT